MAKDDADSETIVMDHRNEINELFRPKIIHYLMRTLTVLLTDELYANLVVENFRS